jgi:Ser-tRNA(Ala) deacylase AlaX
MGNKFVDIFNYRLEHEAETAAHIISSIFLNMPRTNDQMGLKRKYIDLNSKNQRAKFLNKVLDEIVLVSKCLSLAEQLERMKCFEKICTLIN